MAYATDCGYAVSMCQAASGILWKRDLWARRKELRAASAAAVEACSRESLPCEATSPCGTGSCRHAAGDLVLLSLPEVPGKSQRPQPRHGHGTFDVEQGVRPLMELRAGRSRPATAC